MRTHLPIAPLLLALVVGCEPAERTKFKPLVLASAKESAAERVTLKTAPATPKAGPLVSLEKEGTQRRVVIRANVCLREGPLELLLTTRFGDQGKEHEAILTTAADAREIHTLLLGCGAQNGKPAIFNPKYEPASGSKIRVLLRYQHNGATVVVPAQHWIKHASTSKKLERDWVFAGSVLNEHPEDEKAPKLYAANFGDVISIANFHDSMLDLPVQESELGEDHSYGANTPLIPPLQTPVEVLLEPIAARAS